MIPNYTKPQLTIRQVLQTIEGAPAERMTALIVGPQYAVADLSTVNATSTFDASGDSLPLRFTEENGTVWDTSVDNVTVDEPSLKLYAKDAEAQLVTSVDGYMTGTGARGSSTEIRFADNVRDTLGTNIHAGLKGRNIQFGDIVRVRVDGAAEQVRNVVGFLPKISSENEVSLQAISPNNPVALGAPSTTSVSPPATANWSASSEVSVDTDIGLRAVGAKVLVGGQFFLGESFQVTLGAAGTLTYTTSKGLTGSGTFALTAGDVYAYSLTVTDGTLSSVLSGTFTMAPAEIPALGDTFGFTFRPAYTPPAGVVLSANSPAGTYTGLMPNTIFFKLVAYEAADSVTYEVRDSLGKFTPFTVTLPPGEDRTVLLPDDISVDILRHPTSLLVGDVFSVTATPAVVSAFLFDGVKLSSPLSIPAVSDISYTVYADFRKRFTGYLDETQFDGTPISVSGNNAAYPAGLTIYEPARDTGEQYLPLVDSVGTVTAVYRLLVNPTVNESMLIVDSASQIEELFGTSKIANDLSFAVSKAFEGAQGKRVYALRTGGTDAASFAAALKKAERNDLVYSIAVITDDLDAVKVAADHCDAMSQPDIKNFRRCYFGTDVPDEFPVLTQTEEGEPFNVTISLIGDQFRLVEFDKNPMLTALDILPGDMLDLFGLRFPIQDVLSDNELLLSSGPASPASGPATIVKVNNADNAVIYVSNRSKAISTRRAANVWCDSGLGYSKKLPYMSVIPSRFVAAEVAGLRSALVPWLGLTRTEINSVAVAPLMYNKYTDRQLNKAAANGTFIITQELEGGKVFVRHQLTTEVGSGILYYEDSVGTNIDRLSFSFKDELDPLIGKTNVDRETLLLIEDRVFEILKKATQSNTFSLTGPQLISFFNVEREEFKVTVKVHPTFKDRIIVKAIIEPPVPLNGIDAELEAEIGLTL